MSLSLARAGMFVTVFVQTDFPKSHHDCIRKWVGLTLVYLSLFYCLPHWQGHGRYRTLCRTYRPSSYYLPPFSTMRIPMIGGSLCSQGPPET